MHCAKHTIASRLYVSFVYFVTYVTAAGAAFETQLFWVLRYKHRTLSTHNLWYHLPIALGDFDRQQPAVCQCHQWLSVRLLLATDTS